MVAHTNLTLVMFVLLATCADAFRHESKAEKMSVSEDAQAEALDVLDNMTAVDGCTSDFAISELSAATVVGKQIRFPDNDGSSTITLPVGSMILDFDTSKITSVAGIGIGPYEKWVVVFSALEAGGFDVYWMSYGKKPEKMPLSSKSQQYLGIKDLGGGKFSLAAAADKGLLMTRTTGQPVTLLAPTGGDCSAGLFRAKLCRDGYKAGSWSTTWGTQKIMLMCGDLSNVAHAMPIG